MSEGGKENFESELNKKEKNMQYQEKIGMWWECENNDVDEEWQMFKSVLVLEEWEVG